MWIGSFSVRDVKSGTEARTQARKSLHVARTAAIELAVAKLELERIARPGLAVDGNAVAVAG